MGNNPSFATLPMTNGDKVVLPLPKNIMGGLRVRDGELGKDMHNFFTTPDRMAELLDFGAHNFDEFLVRMFDSFRGMPPFDALPPAFSLHYSQKDGFRPKTLQTLKAYLYKVIQANQDAMVVSGLRIPGHANTVVFRFFAEKAHLRITLLEPHTNMPMARGDDSKWLPAALNKAFASEHISVEIRTPYITGRSLQGGDGVCVQWAVLMALTTVLNCNGSTICDNDNLEAALTHVRAARADVMPAWGYMAWVLHKLKYPQLTPQLFSTLPMPPATEPLSDTKVILSRYTSYKGDSAMDPYTCGKRGPDDCPPPCTKGSDGRCHNPGITSTGVDMLRYAAIAYINSAARAFHHKNYTRLGKAKAAFLTKEEKLMRPHLNAMFNYFSLPPTGLLHGKVLTMDAIPADVERLRAGLKKREDQVVAQVGTAYHSEQPRALARILPTLERFMDDWTFVARYNSSVGAMDKVADADIRAKHREAVEMLRRMFRAKYDARTYTGVLGPENRFFEKVWPKKLMEDDEYDVFRVPTRNDLEEVFKEAVLMLRGDDGGDPPEFYRRATQLKIRGMVRGIMHDVWKELAPVALDSSESDDSDALHAFLARTWTIQEADV